MRLTRARRVGEDEARRVAVEARVNELHEEVQRVERVSAAGGGGGGRVSLLAFVDGQLKRGHLLDEMECGGAQLARLMVVDEQEGALAHVALLLPRGHDQLDAVRGALHVMRHCVAQAHQQAQTVGNARQARCRRRRRWQRRLLLIVDGAVEEAEREDGEAATAEQHGGLVVAFDEHAEHEHDGRPATLRVQLARVQHHANQTLFQVARRCSQ